jgi:uncharacterized protein YnzC (UPF0291/DUF896 family)
MDNERQTAIDGDNQIVNNDVTIKDFILWIQGWILYFISKWKILFLAIVLGAAAGIAKNKLSSRIYTAKCHFILDEGNSSGGNGIGGSLALLGLGGSSAGGGGLFQGKNLMWLYSSRLMLQKVLLSPVDSSNGQKTYLEWLLAVDKKGKKLYGNVAGKLKFSHDKLTREENDIISFAVAKISSDYLKVEQTSNADNIITVKVNASDELFAESFANKIIEEVNEYYIKTKTQKITDEVAILQQKVDSFRIQMGSSMYQAASSVDAVPNPNPNRQVLTVQTKKKGVDVNISSELFVEMNKNLEAKRMLLASETPLIQVLERPELPLETNAKSLTSSAVFGASVVFLIASIVLAGLRIYKLALMK